MITHLSALASADGVIGKRKVGRDLLGACERLLVDREPVTLPTRDLVHGDFRPAIVLLGADRVAGVVDIEALGGGTRAFDYDTSRPATESSRALIG